jgi:predicted  nucleic acid-binding Zn-ribbon protein
VAATRAAKKSYEEAQRKLQTMETAVIRLTQEKDALAHRMKVGRLRPPIDRLSS